MYLTLSIFLFSAACALAQSPGQVGASAAGGAAAGAAGKVVSNGFDAIMSQASGLTSKAAQTGKEKEKPPPPRRRAPLPPPDPALPPVLAPTSARPAPPSSIEEVDAATPARRTSRARRVVPKAESMATQIAPSPKVYSEPPVPKKPLVSQELPKVEVGTSRSDLIARLGTPSGRITSVEDSTIIEVYSFREGRTPVGSVRLVNGKVTEVRQTP